MTAVKNNSFLLVASLLHFTSAQAVTLNAADRNSFPNAARCAKKAVSGCTAGRRKGFTLIELLVVVLIIGILVAVALPQYETVVAKSRVVTLLPLVRSIDSAQEVFYLANGVYAKQFDYLDFEMPAGGTQVSSSHISYAGFLCYLRIPEGEEPSVYCNDGKSGARIEKYFKESHFLCWTKLGNPEETDISVKVCRAISGKTTGVLSSNGNGYGYSF